MKPHLKVVWKILLIACLSCRATGAAPAFSPTNQEARIVTIKGSLAITRAGATKGVTTTETNQTLQPSDRLRTGPNSRTAIFLPDEGVIHLDAMTEIEIRPPSRASGSLFLFKGILSFFHRGEPGRIDILSRGGNAGMKGTEFVMAVTETNGAEQTTLSVIDGSVTFSNELDSLTLTNGEQAVAEPGKAPVRTAGFIANNLLQWCFYYPAVLDLQDLSLATEEVGTLANSLAAYRSGDLLAALDNYPADRKPVSDAERIYYAALLLSVGRVEQAETNLSALATTDASEKSQRLVNALRLLIAAVKRETISSAINYQLSTEFLAASYYEQSHAVRETSLKTALQLARQAVTNSPEFGFGWERVAELEFSFGRTDRALEALNKALLLSPRNAQALALKGFLLAAQNKTREAIEWFNQAIQVDSALGNAWLGRGLCRIRRGDAKGRREDLLIAAALEPQRAALRSYLGKAWSDAGDDKRARSELQLAKNMDANDPTAWLYSALNHEQHNRINEAIRDLEKSQEKNDNRSVYRSGLLLDQDRAVRSANLARIYDEAGLSDVAVREASRGVVADYTSYSSHLFLANSYARLNSLTDSNLRYETPAGSEFLLASLLAPAGASALSQRVSQQEYSHLFERNRIGISSATTYGSGGDWMESGSQFGTIGGMGYSLDADYISIRGGKFSIQEENRIISATFKQDFDPRNSLYVHVRRSDASGGDVLSSFNPAQATTGFHFTEEQAPILIAGFHHEWTPESHSLLLFGWLTDDFRFADPNQGTLAIARDGVIDATADFTMHGAYTNSLNLFSLEAQHIYQNYRHRLVLGARVQWGEFNTRSVLTNVPFVLRPPFTDNRGKEVPLDWTERTRFSRYTGYAYYQWSPLEMLKPEVGLTYDVLQEPVNFRYPPLTDRQETIARFSPKAGLLWQLSANANMRLAYTRSLGGATFDQSFQLEPSQVAGINQLYRSLIPDEVAGANSGARFETAGFLFDYHSPSDTYIGLSGDLLNSTVKRTRGAFQFKNGFGPFNEQTPERLDYSEQRLQLSVRQLLGTKWSAGFSYELSRAILQDNFTGIPNGLPDPTGTVLIPRTNHTATLNSLVWFVDYHHPRGWFARMSGRWLAQVDREVPAHNLPNDFWQYDIFAGYRHRTGKFEAYVGLLNLTDQNYYLNPLNVYSSLARQRTLVVSARFDF